MKATRYECTNATAQDDAVLRRLLRETPVEGRLQVTLEREPSFFGADQDVTQHDVALVSHDGTPMACGSRVLRNLYWRGTVQEVAYLGDLRMHPNHQKRGGRGLLAGYRMLTTCAQERLAAATWTAVFASNTTAQSVLVGGRAGLPKYVDRGRLICPLLLIKPRQRWPRETNCTTATTADLPAITSFLQQEFRDRPLAPCLADSDLALGLRWPDLRAEDFVIMRQQQEIVGAVAVRDLRRWKQVRVTRTPWLWKLANLPSRILAACNVCPALPRTNEILAMGYTSFLAVKNDAPDLTLSLLKAARALASHKGLHFLSTAFHESDTKHRATTELPSLKTNGILYQVMLHGEPDPWSNGVPYIDPTCL